MTNRKQLRSALKELLKRIDLLDGKVFASRSIPVLGDGDGERYDLPCVLIYTDRDPATDVDGFNIKRDLVIRIVAVVRVAEGADDELDDMCDAIEVTVKGAFDKDPALGVVPLVSLAEDMTYLDTELTYTGADGRAELAHANMSYTLTYVKGDAMILPGLKEVSIEIDMASPRNDPQIPREPDGQIDAKVRVLFEIESEEDSEQQ